MKLFNFLFVTLLLVFPAVESVSQIPVTVDQIVYGLVGAPFRNDNDFQAPWGASEGYPNCSPSDYDWYYGARPLEWMDHGTNQALSSWGQVFEWVEGSPIKDVRFQIRNHKMFVYTDLEWVLAEDVSADIEAGFFKEEDYSKTESIVGRSEVNNGGGVSFPIESNYCLHWFKKVWGDKLRPEIPNTFEAVYIYFEIRMISGSDESVNVDEAKYLVASGADYYPFTNSTGEENHPGLVMSRHKFLTSEWQSVPVYISGEIPKTVAEYRAEIESRKYPPNVELSTEVRTLDQCLIFSVSPNPANTQLIIEINLLDKKKRVVICDLNGKEIFRRQITGQEMQVDISQWTSGLYFVRLVTENFNEVRKIIIE